MDSAAPKVWHIPGPQKVQQRNAPPPARQAEENWGKRCASAAHGCRVTHVAMTKTTAKPQAALKRMGTALRGS